MADLEIHMERFSLKRTKQSELAAEVSGGCKAVNVFITVIKLMAAVIYMILSLFLIDYGYEDYLMNRGGIVPAGCLLALFIYVLWTFTFLWKVWTLKRTCQAIL